MTYLVLQAHCILLGTVTNGWMLMTQKDIEAVYNTLKENHPGYLEKHSDFKKCLTRGYQEALKHAQTADTYEKYLFTLYRYISSFQDSHLNTWPVLTKQTIEWPGFIARYDAGSDTFKVSFVSEDKNEFSSLPSLDAEIEVCDGMTPKSYMDEFILPYYGGIKNISAHYDKFSQSLFTDRGNPFVPHLATCTFKEKNKTITLPLQWSKISKTDFNNMIATLKPTLPETNLESFMDEQGIWVSLPTFNPETEEQQKKLDHVIAELKENREKPYVVFDLRGNTGGYSTWFLLLLEALFGKAYMDYINSQNTETTLWRSSPDNIYHLENNALPYIEKNFGVESKNYQGTKKLIDTLKEHKNPSTLVRMEANKEAVDVAKPLSTTKIFVVTDGECFSACLEFLDALSNLKNMILLGQPTGVDTKYSSTRIVMLPSGLLEMQFPIALEERSRPDNQPYLPDYTFTGNIYDTPALKKWVISTISNTENK